MSQTESLVRRLAGPSTGKAGVKQDQEEINKIIADASKGSKFYENEKRKDKELTEKIERLLKTKDELLKHADIKKLERAADKMIEDLSQTRDLSSTIIHVDLDSFYASVEVLDNPSLKGKAFGVGYGVLSTASYEARKFGVRSAMPGFIAKKLCPDLIFVKAHFDRYTELSRKVMDILKTYDANMATGGMDEAYLCISKYCCDNYLDPETCVSKIRAHVFEETKLTISAGIASTKMLAKICSDINKPNGQYYLRPNVDNIMGFMKTLPIRKVPGVGRISERLLDSVGIKTCGDVFTHRATLLLLDKQFGCQTLLKVYLGLGSNVVQPGQREERKSVGVERTFNALSDEEKILEKLLHCATELEGDLARTGFAGGTITLKYKLDTFKPFTRAKTCDRYITSKEDLYEIGKELLMVEMPLTLRLIGLRATRLKDLRADPSKGIKRFFTSDENGSSSPRKKPKLDGEVDEPEPVDGYRHIIDVDDNAEEDESSNSEVEEKLELDPDVMPPPNQKAATVSRSSSRARSMSVVPTTANEESDIFKLPEHLNTPKKRRDEEIAAALEGLRPPSMEEEKVVSPAPKPKPNANAKPTFSTFIPPHIVKALARARMPPPRPKIPDPPPESEKPAATSPDKPKQNAKQLTLQRGRIAPPRRPARATRSPSPTTSAPANPDAKKQRCPLCYKTFVLDNAAMNAHIDWCLSKGAIKEASKG